MALPNKKKSYIDKNKCKKAPSSFPVNTYTLYDQLPEVLAQKPDAIMI